MFSSDGNINEMSYHNNKLNFQKLAEQWFFNVSTKVYDTDQNSSVNKVRNRAVVNSADYLPNYH